MITLEQLDEFESALRLTLQKVDYLKNALRSGTVYAEHRERHLYGAAGELRTEIDKLPEPAATPQASTG